MKNPTISSFDQRLIDKCINKAIDGIDKMYNIFSAAWILARIGQENYGGKMSMYFREALKQTWAAYHENKKSTEILTADKLAMAICDASNEFYTSNNKKECLSIVAYVADLNIGFASEVAKTVVKYGKASIKQAHIIAKAIITSNLSINSNVAQYGRFA